MGNEWASLTRRDIKSIRKRTHYTLEFRMHTILHKHLCICTQTRSDSNATYIIEQSIGIIVGCMHIVANRYDFVQHIIFPTHRLNTIIFSFFIHCTMNVYTYLLVLWRHILILVKAQVYNSNSIVNSARRVHKVIMGWIIIFYFENTVRKF